MRRRAEERFRSTAPRDALLPLLSNVAVKALHGSQPWPSQIPAAAAAAKTEIASRSDRVAAAA